MIRAFSTGSGVQSTAALVLAAQGEIDFRTFIFANTGDDSEHPATLRYLREIAKPYATAHDIELLELEPPRRKGEVETLLGRLNTGRMAIPVRRRADGPPMSRQCTYDFKVARIGKELKRRGATRDNPATVGLGITVDEIERAKPGTSPGKPYQFSTYPLLDLGLHRRDCHDIIRDAGLPPAPKSACWFCPFHDMEAWRSLRREEPELFEQAVMLEETLAIAKNDGRPVFLTRHGIPLDRAVGDEQMQLDGMDGCDSGWCMT